MKHFKALFEFKEYGLIDWVLFATCAVTAVKIIMELVK